MNNLSQECIKAITVHEECYYQDYCENRNTKIRSTFMVGAIEALTNPTIYQSAGLMSVEQLEEFISWAYRNAERIRDGWVHDYKVYTTTDLLTIFRNQNQEK